ncbi:hypothetical protein HDU96_000892 [Phlyctochytrium bullatum]|nr:hypothetical protein HDU96_000892 [Phlyctochytrium bullatum]
MRLPPELLKYILTGIDDLNVVIATELLHTFFPHPFWIRIQADPAAGPIRDAVEPLLPEAWASMTESFFPRSLAISKSLLVEPGENVETVPAFRLAWMAKFRPDLLTFKFATRAARAGRLDLIRILDAFGIPKFCMATMDAAAEGGHLSLVKYLHFRRAEGCTSLAITKAAKGGFLDVIRFLHANRNEGCQNEALADAAVGGHLEVVSFLQTEMDLRPHAEYCNRVGFPTRHLRYLHENLGWPITESLVYVVMIRGTSEEFRYCLAQLPFISPTTWVDHRDEATKESWLGNLKVMLEVFGDDKRFWVPQNIDNLASHGHADMLEYLFEKREERCTEQGLCWAARSGNADVFRVLVMKDRKAAAKLNEEALKEAAYGGSVEILKLLRTFSHLTRDWNSALTNEACARSRADAVRYLCDELGLPITQVPYGLEQYIHPRSCQPNPVLFDLESFGYTSSHQELLTNLLYSACRWGTLEQVARFSARVSWRTNAFMYGRDRLDVLRFLLENRPERPEPWTFFYLAIATAPLEVIQWSVDELGLKPDVKMLERAVIAGKFDIVVYLYNFMPSDVSLDGAFRFAVECRHFERHFEMVKFLHLKRRMTGQLQCNIEQVESIDLATFLIENYSSQFITRELYASTLMRNSSFDVVKYLIECGHMESLTTIEATRIGSLSLDFAQYALRKQLFDSTWSLVKYGVDSGRVSILKILFDAFPENFTAQTVRSASKGNYSNESTLRGALQVLSFLSAKLPHLITPDILTNVLGSQGNDAQMIPQIAFLLNRHPDCVLPEVHLTMAAEKNTVSALLLWDRWSGGCPAKAVEAACRRKDSWLLKRFLERFDAGDSTWKAVVKKCLTVAKRYKDDSIFRMLRRFEEDPKGREAHN